MRVHERFYPRQGVDEIFCQLGERYLSDDNQQRDAMSNYGRKFVRRVADSFVMGYADAAVAATMLQPLLIGAVGWKEVTMPLHGQAGRGEYFGETFT